MVRGMELFREHFRGYEDCYTIIGGAACDILMTEAAMDFRATKDIDMILLIESRFEEFAEIFWSFVREGQYKCGWKNSETPHFYRFTEPKGGYPTMIELFSRRPDFQEMHSDAYLTPLPVSDEISSLSAIMLDNDYYNLMLSGRKNMNGISVLGAEYLIVFKIKAHLDLLKRRAEGDHVNDKDLKKHKNDVFRLYAIVDPQCRIQLNARVQSEVEDFLEMVETNPVNLKNLGLDEFTYDEIIEGIRKIYLSM